MVLSNMFVEKLSVLVEHYRRVPCNVPVLIHTVDPEFSVMGKTQNRSPRKSLLSPSTENATACVNGVSIVHMSLTFLMFEVLPVRGKDSSLCLSKGR